MKIKQVVWRRISRVMVYTLIGSILGLLAGYISSLLDGSDYQERLSITGLGFSLGLILGIQFGILEEFLWRIISRKVSHITFTTVQFSTYILLIIIWLIIAVSIEHVIMDGMSFSQGMQTYIGEEDLVRDIIFAVIMAILLIVIGKLRMLQHSRELFSLFTGKYYYPVEEIRTIMFVDLAGSTSIAEELGTIRFSSFLQDWFSDISESIFAWHGYVYQYLGDGFILSWRKNHDKSGIFPINCFYDMQRIINEKQDYYLSKYGRIPSFRAGIHKGPVIATWVGERKKELALHGDTINTASRIQTLCKEYNASLLVSKEALDSITLPDHLTTKKIGDVIPQGKSNFITLYTISQKTSSSY